MVDEHQGVMVFVGNNIIYYLVEHYRYLTRAEMLQHKVKLGSNTLKLDTGFHYLYKPL